MRITATLALLLASILALAFQIYPLFTEKEKFPCAERMNPDCIAEQIMLLADGSTEKERKSIASKIAGMALQAKSPALAQAYLDKLSVKPDKPSAQHLQMRFLVSRQEEDMPALQQMVIETKNAPVDAVVKVLIAKNQLDQAMDLIKTTYTQWQEKDVPEGFRASCTNKEYKHPRMVQDVALAHLKNNDIIKAFDTADFLKNYWEDPLVQHYARCFHYDTQSLYEEFLSRVFIYTLESDPENARPALKRLFEQMDKNLHLFTTSKQHTLERNALTAAKAGNLKISLWMAETAVQHNLAQFKKNATDPSAKPKYFDPLDAAYFYALGGEPEKAIELIKGNTEGQYESIESQRQDPLAFYKKRMRSYHKILRDLESKENANVIAKKTLEDMQDDALFREEIKARHATDPALYSEESGTYPPYSDVPDTLRIYVDIGKFAATASPDVSRSISEYLVSLLDILRPANFLNKKREYRMHETVETIIADPEFEFQRLYAGIATLKSLTDGEKAAREWLKPRRNKHRPITDKISRRTGETIFSAVSPDFWGVYKIENDMAEYKTAETYAKEENWLLLEKQLPKAAKQYLEISSNTVFYTTLDAILLEKGRIDLYKKYLSLIRKTKTKDKDHKKNVERNILIKPFAAAYHGINIPPALLNQIWAEHKEFMCDNRFSHEKRSERMKLLQCYSKMTSWLSYAPKHSKYPR